MVILFCQLVISVLRWWWYEHQRSLLVHWLRWPEKLQFSCLQLGQKRKQNPSKRLLCPLSVLLWQLREPDHDSQGQRAQFSGLTNSTTSTHPDLNLGNCWWGTGAEFYCDKYRWEQYRPGGLEGGKGCRITYHTWGVLAPSLSRDPPLIASLTNQVKGLTLLWNKYKYFCQSLYNDPGRHKIIILYVFCNEYISMTMTNACPCLVKSVKSLLKL